MAETKKAETAKEETEKTVVIKLPKPKKDEGNSVGVWVNEKSWLIQKGIEVEVPECVAEVLHNAELMEAEAYEFEQSVQR